MLPIYRLVICIFSFLAYTALHATVQAQNLVENGSFEDYNIDSLNGWLPYSKQSYQNIFLAEYWYSNDKGDPEYYRSDTLLPNSRVTTELWGNYPETFDSAKVIDGSAWIGICSFVWSGYSERITGQLSKALHKDSIYEISFYARLSKYSSFCLKTIGIQFHNALQSDIKNSSPYYSTEKFQRISPDVVLNISETCYTKDWIKVRGTFIAKGGESYFTIGYFYPQGFNWSKAISRYNNLSMKKKFDQLKACKKLVRKAPDIKLSTEHIKEDNPHEIAYYYIDNVSIIQVRLSD